LIPVQALRQRPLALLLALHAGLAGQDGVVESLTLDDWRPASFLVVAQLDLTADALEALAVLVEFDEGGEHTAVLRLSGGLVFCLVATPPFVPGFVLLCGDPGSMGWEQALDGFLSQTPFERSAVVWVPGDEPDET
jgi:hypothetical protein